MGLLGKDDLEAMEDDIPTEEVVVPEWKNQTVRIRSLTAAERNEYNRSLIYNRTNKAGDLETVADTSNAETRLVVKALIDAKGNLLYPIAEQPIAAVKLGKRNPVAINRIYERIKYLSGMTKKSAEELEKNSAASPSGDSSSL